MLTLKVHDDSGQVLLEDVTIFIALRMKRICNYIFFLKIIAHLLGPFQCFFHKTNGYRIHKVRILRLLFPKMFVYCLESIPSYSFIFLQSLPIAKYVSSYVFAKIEWLNFLIYCFSAECIHILSTRAELNYS